MMRTPINTDLAHIAPGYDPLQAHKYYEEHKHLKGRKKGVAQPQPSTSSNRVLPTKAKAPNRVSPAKAKQKIALQNSITNLATQLGKLEALIKEKEAILRKNQARAKVKARQTKDKPKTAADKAQAARENAKYRDKHKQELKNKAKQADAKSGGSSKSAQKSQKPSDMSIANLKALATKVKGQLVVAKQKLAAL